MHSVKEEIVIADQVVGIQVEIHFIRISEMISRRITKWIIVDIIQRERILSDKSLMINFRAKKDVIMLVIVLDATIDQGENSTSRKASKKGHKDMIIEIIFKSHAPIIHIF